LRRFSSAKRSRTTRGRTSSNSVTRRRRETCHRISSLNGLNPAHPSQPESRSAAADVGVSDCTDGRASEDAKPGPRGFGPRGCCSLRVPSNSCQSDLNARAAPKKSCKRRVSGGSTDPLFKYLRHHVSAGNTRVPFAGLLSPLTDSNRRPPPYHLTPAATSRNPRQQIWLDPAVSTAG
jgi:hypothetical protein